MKEWVSGHTMISNGPRFLLDSFLEGRMVWKYLAFTKTESLTLSSGRVEYLASAGPWYCC